MKEPFNSHLKYYCVFYCVFLLRVPSHFFVLFCYLFHCFICFACSIYIHSEIDIIYFDLNI